MSPADTPLDAVLARLRAAAGERPVDLLAVSKTRSADEVRRLAARGQRRFGENYVQEAMAKRAALADLDLEWHLIGHLQSNKCREAAATFDWVESVDRTKLVTGLAAARDPARAPLNVLIQVNIDDEAAKSGCAPAAVGELAAAIRAQPRLRLRGLMAIPAPGDPARLRAAFAAMRRLFDALRATAPEVDTLSMGMSDDFVDAIAAGATQVRIGTALFGPRAAR
jgi:PLP dependent protein